MGKCIQKQTPFKEVSFIMGIANNGVKGKQNKNKIKEKERGKRGGGLQQSKSNYSKHPNHNTFLTTLSMLIILNSFQLIPRDSLQKREVLPWVVLILTDHRMLQKPPFFLGGLTGATGLTVVGGGASEVPPAAGGAALAESAPASSTSSTSPPRERVISRTR